MVGNVLSKYNESNGNVCYEDGENIGPGDLAEALEGFEEGEVGDAEESLYRENI